MSAWLVVGCLWEVKLQPRVVWAVAASVVVVWVAVVVSLVRGLVEMVVLVWGLLRLLAVARYPHPCQHRFLLLVVVVVE